MTLNKKTGLALSACLILGLSACQTAPYVPTLYDANSANVKSMAISDDALPDEMGANELASAAGTGQAAMLKTKLMNAGYEGLDVVEVERGKKSILKEMPETDADAVLNVQMKSFGVQKAVTGQEWRPAAGVMVQLVQNETSEILMENMISYNSGVLGVAQTEGFITMEPRADSVGYMKIKEMDPEVVRDETMKMLDEISSMIVTLL